MRTDSIGARLSLRTMDHRALHLPATNPQITCPLVMVVATAASGTLEERLLVFRQALQGVFALDMSHEATTWGLVEARYVFGYFTLPSYIDKDVFVDTRMRILSCTPSAPVWAPVFSGSRLPLKNICHTERLLANFGRRSFQSRKRHDLSCCQHLYQ